MKSKYAVLEALFITIFITTTALISAGAAYKWKYGDSGKVILTCETYVSSDGKEAQWGSGIYDWNENDGIEYVSLYYKFKYVINGESHTFREGYWPGQNSWAYGEAYRASGATFRVEIDKAITIMKGWTKKYGFEGRLSTWATPTYP